MQISKTQVIYPDFILITIISFFFRMVSCLHCKHDSYWISTRSLFSGADYTRKMHHIFLCYGLLLTKDSKLFVINLISLRAISSSVAGVLSVKDQICWFESLKAYLSVKSCLLRGKKPNRFMCNCIYLFIFTTQLKLNKTCCKLKATIKSLWVSH